MSAQDGQFVWYELLTTNEDAAKAFYTEVVGWKIMAFEGGDKPYSMWAVGEQPIGGVMTLPDEVAAQGVPPNWIGHIKVADVDAIVARAKELGAVLHREPEDIPTVGRFAVLADPQGAAFSVFAPVNDMKGAGGKQPGEVTWHELNTTDWESADKFYSELFGWETVEDMDMGDDMGVYHMFTWPGGEGARGGMSNFARAQGFPASWLFYVTVDDLDAALERVEGNGGTVTNGPMDVPGGDKVAMCTDPQGGMFALHWANPEGGAGS